MWWALVGCVASLPEVHIEVSGEDRRAVVREVVEAFARDTAPHCTVVRRIEDADEGDPLGAWSPRERVIRLRESLSGDELRRVVRHELCHALDDALDPSDELLFYDAHAELYDHYDRRWVRRQLERVGGSSCVACEVFADFCDEGPLIARAFGNDCHLDLGSWACGRWIPRGIGRSGTTTCGPGNPVSGPRAWGHARCWYPASFPS